MADTYSNMAEKTTNYGSSVLLPITSGTRPYIKFSLATLPAGAAVSKATLRLYVDAYVSAGSFDVYQLGTSWTESGLTYNNEPGVEAIAAGPVAVSSASLNQFVLIDITPLVKEWYAGSVANDGIALALVGAAGSFSFDSKESVLTSHQPELEIALSGPIGPQGPQGQQGPTGAMGAAGPQGKQGLTGATGAAGPQGKQGPTGAMGAAGPQGKQGLTGAAGAAGPQGKQGLTGAAGAAGPQGTQGLTGATGATGPLGPVGLTGNAGPAGPAGGVGANGQGFHFTGPFNSATSYSPYDVVTSSGSTYVAIVASQGGATPTPTPPPGTSWPRRGWQVPAARLGPAGATGLTGATGPTGLAGPAGPQGPIGPLGPQGPAGADGANGTNGTNGTGLSFRSAWVSTTAYAVNDVVTENGNSYIGLAASTGADPASDNGSNWSLLAQAGAQGAAGPAGPAGPTGPVGLNGPQGSAGPQGPAGAQGPAGRRDPLDRACPRAT